MVRSEKPALTVSEIRKLSSEEGWDDARIAIHFGVKAIDIADIRKKKGIQKKRVYEARYTLVDDEEEVVQSPGESVMAETVVQEVGTMEEQAVEAVPENTITEDIPALVEDNSTVTESTVDNSNPTSTGW